MSLLDPKSRRLLNREWEVEVRRDVDRTVWFVMGRLEEDVGRDQQFTISGVEHVLQRG